MYPVAGQGVGQEQVQMQLPQNNGQMMALLNQIMQQVAHNQHRLDDQQEVIRAQGQQIQVLADHVDRQGDEIDALQDEVGNQADQILGLEDLADDQGQQINAAQSEIMDLREEQANLKVAVVVLAAGVGVIGGAVAGPCVMTEMAVETAQIAGGAIGGICLGGSAAGVVYVREGS